MSMYGIKEIAIITLIGILVMAGLPEHFWQIMGVVLLGYGALSALSARAFRQAVENGVVRTARQVEGQRPAFFIAQGCQHRWLVRRHIRVYG